ncbi:alpha/beta fold hydrolase [Luteimonas vadosa]|uniref:HTH luxR-type domain-containing protein n=1 Tax=Luteimonas vadosa TaxID=1165507 RepID=A0ABP9DXZ3_9GAMM
MKQSVRYIRTSDDISLAWAEVGRGMPLVKAANWLTHLEYDWESPVWRHWTRFFATHYRYVRHDERGCGMTDWNAGDLSLSRWVRDLEQVVEAAGIDEPFALLGISQGAAIAIAYAVRHPGRVSHLILYGGYATGIHKSGDAGAIRTFHAITELMRSGWDKDNPVFRQLFTSRFIPGGSAEQLEWFNDLCRRTTSAEIGARLMEARGNVDVGDLLSKVRTPTLVMQASNDQVNHPAMGRRLAREIPDAQFVLLESANHVLLENESAWLHFREAILEFTGQHAASDGIAASDQPKLTPRENAVLALLCEGHSNAQIAWQLDIAEKTARNHVSHLYEKLGVHSRAEAIVYAHRRGLHG